MKKFQIFRYLKKFRFFILILTAAACVFIYKYTTVKQQYVATTVIEYTNETASDGTTPSGDKIDVKEIFCASVITDVIADLGLNTNVDSIRSKCKVEEIIPEEETSRKAALLDKGEEYEYNPTRYKVTFTASSDKSKRYARDVLDSIISNYFEFYSQKYVEVSVVPNNISNVSASKYDYLDCVEMIDESVSDIEEYLGSKDTASPNFRSSRTGYTFSDLKDQYSYIIDSVMPNMYSTIYAKHLVKDKVGLVKKYQKRAADDQINISNLDTQISELVKLTDQYADKIINSDSDKGKYNFSEESNLIIGDVQDYHDNPNKETTYDSLINKYITLSSNRVDYKEDLQHVNEVIEIFSDDTIQNITDEDIHTEITKQINSLTEELDEMYVCVIDTVSEYNEVVGAQNISTISSINAVENINVKLYLLLALALFLILGCAGAVFLGRLGDFVNYYMYTNKITGLPNRNNCNIMIDELSKKALPEEFTCIVFKLKTLARLNRDLNRESGNFALMSFGKILKESSDGFGFVGYNDGDNFIALLENCTIAKAKVFITLVEKGEKNLNELEEKDVVEFSYGMANSSDDNVYEIRKLLSKAFSNVPREVKKD